MSIARRKRLWLAALVCGAGTVFQVLPKSCTDYFTMAALSSFDFCSVFNCTGGSFFNVCEPTALFMDCPNLFATQPNP
jgi:hypothetical protein